MQDEVNDNISVMSIGSGCPITQICKNLGIRESGPIDWVLEDQSINHLTLDLFSGNLFDCIVNKRWETSTNFDIGVDGKAGYEIQASVCGGTFIHEDIVNDPDQWKKVLYRLLKFEKWVKEGGKFIRHIWEKDVNSPTGLPFFISYLRYHGIDPNRVLFVCDYFDINKEVGRAMRDRYNELMKSQGINIYYLPVDSITHYIESPVEVKNEVGSGIITAAKMQWG